jgi:hypothetical protein
MLLDGLSSRRRRRATALIEPAHERGRARFALLHVLDNAFG